jgi:hypothetical protein
MRGVSRDDARGMRWEVFCFARPIRSLVSARRVARRTSSTAPVPEATWILAATDRAGDSARRLATGRRDGSIEDASGARGEGARERNDDDFDVMC